QPPPPNHFPTSPHLKPIIIPWPRLWTHFRLALELHRHPPDIFFTPAHVIPFTYRRPSIATIHDLGYHHFPTAHPPAQRRQLLWSTQHNAHRARHIITDSDATKKDIHHFYHTPLAKMTTVYPGPTPELAPVTDMGVITAVLHRLNLPSPYFLYLGTLQPRKNLVRLIHAYAAYSRQTPAPHALILAGRQGWLATDILNTLDTLPPTIRQQIHLPGYIAETDKAPLLSGATALLFPSLYEGFGFPILEAQTCHTPVLTANNSSLPEVAAQSAHIVPATDTDALTQALLRLAQDQTYRQQLITAGQQNITRFSWPQAAQQTLTLLEQHASHQKHHK
ncbi:MAG TPA: glycosyltransferase family 1 protein, partial [Anaerolineae bacterium]|nr:glycosyltransferase family 1 protein [Anaerolineae bacterium]